MSCIGPEGYRGNDTNDQGMLSMDRGLEAERQNGVLHQILQLRGSERVQAFRDLSPEQQLVLFFPDDVTSNSLPPMDPPTDWDQRVQKAIQSCKESLRQLFRKRPHAQYNPDHSGQSSQGGFNAPDPWEEQVAFLEALEYCIPMTAAFHVLAIFARAGDNKCCYCPCGKHMEKWRQFTSMQNFASCDYKGQKDPASLWKHVLTKKEDCSAHRVVYLFLENVFQNYHAEGIQHIALEDNQSCAYKKAERCIMNDLKSQIDALKRENKAKYIRTAQLKNTKECHETLQQVNEELASKLGAEKKLKEKYGAWQSMEETLSPKQEQFAKRQYDVFREDIFATLDRENVSTRKPVKPILPVSHGFNSNDVFQRWYNKFVHEGRGKLDYSLDPEIFGFLFASINVSKRKEVLIRQAELRSQLGNTWEVTMKKDTTLMEQIGVADLDTEDKGGPTRYFFSRLWNQLGNLAIQLPKPDEDKKEGREDDFLRLFESCQGGLLPMTDEILVDVYTRKRSNGKTIQAQVEAYYRAIGRILAHCMLKSIVVATHVLPDLYKTVLVRGLEIEKEEYPLGLLIDHAGALLDVDYSKKDEPPETLLQRKLGLKDSDVNDSLPLRKQIKKIFFDSRSLSLKYLTKGLTFDGIINWRTVFGWVPSPTMNKLVFGCQDITMEMVFSTDGSLRFVQFKQDFDDKEKSLPYKDIQEQFETQFTDFVRRKMEDDPSFICTFVEFCTGSPFLPDIDLNPDFHIQLEYNASEMDQEFLPVVHTCDNCIKIPAKAYNADIEKFQEKLATAMRLSQTNFDMH